MTEYIRVHLPTRTANREPLPAFLIGLMPESLVDLTWSDPALGVHDYVWLPVVDVETAFDPETHAVDRDNETYVADLVAGVVHVTPGTRPLTADELAAKAMALKVMKDQLVQNVDDKVAGIYSKWMRFESEYREREAAARRFKDAGYSGDAGIWVTAFATSAGMAVQQAVDLIILQADQLRTALEQLGALRMKKYAILGAVSTAAAQTKHDEIINQANTIAAQLG